MTFQVLISTLNGNPRELVKKMRIDSDAIIINQCNRKSEEKFTYKKHLIQVFNTTDRGIGKSRKMALSLASADIVLFADDDEKLEHDYSKMVSEDFDVNPDVDFFIYDITDNTSGSSRTTKNICKKTRVRWFNSLKYGTKRFAVRRESVTEKGITFNEDFGASKYSHGEDTIFIHDCLKNGLKIFTIPKSIAIINFSDSTWFNGYNRKYYEDTGALFGALFGIKAIPLIASNSIRHKTSFKNLKLEFSGLKKYYSPRPIKKICCEANPISLAIIMLLAFYLPNFLPNIPTETTTTIRTICLVAICIISFLHFVHSKKQVPKINILIAGFLATSTIFVWIFCEHSSLSKEVVEYCFIPLAMFLSYIVFFYDYKMPPSSFKKICYITIGLCVITCLYSAIKEANLFPKFLAMNGGYSVKLQSIFNNRNSFGFLLANGVFANLYLLATEKSSHKNALLVLSLVSILFFSLLTMSRTALLFITICIAGFAYICYRKAEKKKTILCVFGFIISIALIIFLIPQSREFILSNIIRLKSGLTNRGSIYIFGLDYFYNHNLLIGGGFTNPLADLSNALGYKGFHNSFLSVLVSAGVIGLAGYTLLIFYTYSNIKKILKYNKTMGVMFLSYLIALILSSCFESNVLFWTTPNQFLITLVATISPLYLSNYFIFNQSVSQNKKVTIIIPTYKRPKKLERAIESALSQTYQNIEIIVIDDNARYPEIRKNTQKIVSKYPQIRLIMPNKNLGGGEARNIGIESATGEFVAFLDDDDEFLPIKIEKQIKLYEQMNIEHKKIGLIYCYEYSKKYNSSKCKIVKKDHEGNAFFKHLCFFTMPTSTWLCPKSVLEKIGGFENIKSQQDLMLLMRILAAGYEIFRVPEPLVLFNVHAPGKGISKHGDDFIEQVKHYNNECKKNYDSLSGHKKRLVNYSFSHRLFNCYLSAKKYNEARDELIEMIKTRPLRKRTIESCIKWITR